MNSPEELLSKDCDLYLASQSPRRRELLQQIGVRYRVVKITLSEEIRPGEAAAEYVSRLAVEKARAGYDVRGDLPALGADTIVVLGKEILGKPKDRENALRMLARLSGKVHQVMTAVSLCCGEQQEVLLSKTDVSFRDIGVQEAEHYWESSEPCDKAGSYGIQGKGGIFVKAINGSYSAVVGLPLYETARLLNAFAIPYWSEVISSNDS